MPIQSSSVIVCRIDYKCLIAGQDDGGGNPSSWSHGYETMCVCTKPDNGLKVDLVNDWSWRQADILKLIADRGIFTCRMSGTRAGNNDCD